MLFEPEADSVKARLGVAQHGMGGGGSIIVAPEIYPAGRVTLALAKSDSNPVLHVSLLHRFNRSFLL